MEHFGSWSVITTNFIFILFLGLGGAVLPAILHLVDGEWRYQIRDYSCAFISLLPIAFILLVILLFRGDLTFQWLTPVGGGDFSLFQWLLDDRIDHWNHYGFLVTRQIAGFLIVAGLCYQFAHRQQRLTAESPESEIHRYRNTAVAVLFAYVLYGTMVAWDFEMTMVEEWHSAIYGAYHFVSNFHGFLALFTLFLYGLRFSGVHKPFDEKVFNALAQLLLGFTLLWIYFFFSQYIIIWYGRLPFEIDRINAMMYDGFGPLWWLFLVLKCFIPFLFFAVVTPCRHKPLLVSALASLIVVGTWIERYTWIAGSVEPEFFHLPMTTPFEIVVTVVLVAACWFTINRALTKCLSTTK